MTVAKAVVFKFAQGGSRMKVVKVAALAASTQSSLAAHAQEGAGRAKAVLAAHRDTGRSRIDVESGKVDRYVTLEEGTLQSALSMEYDHRLRDRKGQLVRGPKTGEPIYIVAPKPLRKAFGLA